MRFGPSVNAYTSFDETVYMLQVPTDKPEVLDKAFLILEDWAHNVSFDADGDRQGARRRHRGVAAAARRGRAHAGQAVPGPAQGLALRRAAADRQDRDPPDLQARAAEAVLRGLVPAGPDGGRRRRRLRQGGGRRAHQGSTSATIPASPATEAAARLRRARITRARSYAIATDKEAPQTTRQRSTARCRCAIQTTVGAYRQQIVERLFGGMLSTRFAEMAQKPDAPFLGAGAGRGQLRPDEGGVDAERARQGRRHRARARGALHRGRARRAVRVHRDRARPRRSGTSLRGLERAVAEKDNQQSATRWPTSTCATSPTGEPIPGIVYENGALPAVPAGDHARRGQRAREELGRPTRNRVVVVSAPAEGRAGGADADEARGRRSRRPPAKDARRRTWTRSARSRCSTRAPTPGAVAKTTTKDAFGITEWELSNGVKVVLKPTTFKEDEILFRAFSPGGTSLASDAGLHPGRDGRRRSSPAAASASSARSTCGRC